MKQLSFFFFLCLIVIACAEKKSTPSSTNILGKKVYKQSCMICHGADGKLGANGSKDLTKSIMNMDERKAIIKNGKGAMVGLGTLLNAAEIEAVAKYTQQLGK